MPLQDSSNLEFALGLAVLVVGVQLLQVVQGASRVEALGARERAEADLVALTELHVAAELLEALIGELVTAVDNPAVGLHEDGGAEVVLRMPPVAGARALAASAQDALVEAVEELAVVLRLVVLAFTRLLLRLALQEGVDRLVLGVEVAHVDDEVFQHEHEHERGDGRLGDVFLRDGAQAGQVVPTVDVHGAGATDTLAAAATEGERGVDLVLDLDEGIKEHRAALLGVDVVGNVLRAVVGVARIGAVDVEALHLILLILSQALVEFLGVVDLEDVGHVSDAYLRRREATGVHGGPNGLTHDV